MDNRTWVLRPNGKPALVVQYGIARNVPGEDGKWRVVRRFQVEWVTKTGRIKRAWYDETEVTAVQGV